MKFHPLSVVVLAAVRPLTMAFVQPSNLYRTMLPQRMSMVAEETTDVSIPYDAAARLSYDEWRAQYNKGDFDASRYENFKANYEAITIVNVSAKKQARDTDSGVPNLLTLNEFGDCTEEEYMAATTGAAQSQPEQSTGNVLGKALEAAQSQSEASSALEDAANALAEEEEKLAKQLGLESVEELEIALDSLEGIAEDGGELERDNLAREARIRSAYMGWCKDYGRPTDEARFPVFSDNFLLMEEYANKTGKKMSLNAYADCTKEEYERKVKEAQAAMTQEELAAKQRAEERQAAERRAAAQAAKEKEARDKARAEAEATRKALAEAAAKSRAEAEVSRKKKMEEEAARQEELRQKQLALKEWQAKSEAERRAVTEKERAARQKSQDMEREKLRQESEAAAIAAARAVAEREAAQVAERRAINAKASALARKSAQEWEERQRQMSKAKAPAPARKPAFSFWETPVKKPAPPVQAKKPAPAPVKKPLSAPKTKKAEPSVDLFASFFSTKAAPKPAPKPFVAPKVAPSRPPPAAKKAPAPAFSFFSPPKPKAAPAPKPKPVVAPAPSPRPAAKKVPAPAPAFSFFSSKPAVAPTPKAEPAPAPAPVPVPKKATPSFFSAFFPPPKPAPKPAPAPAPAPAPVPVAAAKKPAPKTAFSFFGSPSPKPSPKPKPKTPVQIPDRPGSINLFSIGSIPVSPKKAVVKAKTPDIPNNVGTFSLFGSSSKTSPPKRQPPAAPSGSGTISLFGSSSKAPPASSKAAKAAPAFSFFGGSPALPQTKAPPPNVSVLSRWVQNKDGSITGIISNSSQFRSGQKITTSPIEMGAKTGSVVKTKSGSQYLLK